MTKRELLASFDNMTPDTIQTDRILNAVLNHEQPRASKPAKTRRKLWYSAAACLALALTFALLTRPGGGSAAYALSVSVSVPDGSTILLEDRSDNYRPAEPSFAVSYVDNGPQLRFFIGGDIAKIEISSENEFVTAHDFTETLDEKFWNPELYYVETEIDGKTYQYVPAKAPYDKSITLEFPEGFERYEDVWFDWYGWNLSDWAREDTDARLHKYNSMSDAELEAFLETASEQEKLAIAAGGGGSSNAGHIILDGYPQDKLTDRVTITVTDRAGNTATKALTVTVSSNALGQNVVTAIMSN